MLVATAGGNTYTRGELAAWMSEAGLSGPERLELAAGTGLLVGTRR